MTGPPSETGDSKDRKKPVTVVNSTRITVAFPFSQIKLQEPAEETMELVAIVEDLTEVVATLSPGAATETLRQRVLALRARLNGTPPPG